MVARLDAEDDSPADREDTRRRSEALDECLDSLEENAGQSIRLRYLEHKTSEEIAETMGRSSGAIRTLLYRARAQLRTCMESKGVFVS